MQETIEQKRTPLVQSAARSGWMLFILAVIFVQLSRRIPGALVPCEIAALTASIVGIVCGIYGLAGTRKHGVSKILWPSIIGISLNGFLVFIFVTNFASARAAANHVAAQGVQATPHLGTWDTQTPRGDAMSYTFTSDRFMLAIGGTRELSGSYTMDYTKNPIWLTIETQDANDNKQRMPFIIEFQGKNRMRMLGPARGTDTRAENFVDRSDVLIFNRRL